MESSNQVSVTLVFLFYLVICLVWGYVEGSKRTIGSTAGVLLGLFLGIIGIIIIYCSSKVNKLQIDNLPFMSNADELNKYKQLLDSGAITETEYNIQKEKLLKK
ncbi:MAG: SHOCT domain-containing protein [Sphingobacteriales bacterium]